MSNSEDRPTAEHLCLRPTGHLRQFPVKYQWELTRRHPYYLQLWEIVHRWHSGDILPNSPDRLLAEAGRIVLLRIGVTGDPPSPRTSAEDLGTNQLAAAWQGGAVAPAIFRGLCGMLITDLPKETRCVVGQILLDSTKDGDEAQNKHSAVTALHGRKDSALDAMPPRPFLGINIEAPLRAILKGVRQQVGEWKKQAGVREHRWRKERHEPSLCVWDLHEGWAGDSYSIEDELSFKEISKKLRVPERTVANRYY